MSTNGLTLTLTGWVGTEPKHFAGATPYTSFRLASTRRVYDARQATWVDGKTLWFTVKVWREAALNVAESLRKSDPVVVHGRLSTEEWESPEGQRIGLVLEATAIGPDLTYGQARFARTVHRTSQPGVEGERTGTDDELGDPALEPPLDDLRDPTSGLPGPLADEPPAFEVDVEAGAGLLVASGTDRG